MINISAQTTNQKDFHEVIVQTNNNQNQILIPAKENGYGSSINGGELLFLALASCFTNDIYREAKTFGINVSKVNVIVSGEFKSEPGSIAENIRYDVYVEAMATDVKIEKLIRHTDTVAEIQNTLRTGLEVKLNKISTKSIIK